MWKCAPSRKCWRLVVRNIDGTPFEPCVSREEYDRTQLGAYWRVLAWTDRPVSHPVAVTRHRLMQRSAYADWRQVLGALDAAASRVIMDAWTKRTR